jgi:hypothetical protein
MKANDVGRPTFDGKFMNYPKLKHEWRAYQQTLVGNDLVAKILREKCISECPKDGRERGGSCRDMGYTGHQLREAGEVYS